MTTEFDNETSPASHAEFERWRSEHPRGFVINRQSRERGMLHFANCYHMTFRPEDNVSLTRNPKLASTDAIKLLMLAAQQGITVSLCGDCHPRAEA